MLVDDGQYVFHAHAKLQLLRGKDSRITVAARVAGSVEQVDGKLLGSFGILLKKTVARRDGVGVSRRTLRVDQDQNQLLCSRRHFVLKQFLKHVGRYLRRYRNAAVLLHQLVKFFIGKLCSALIRLFPHCDRNGQHANAVALLLLLWDVRRGVHINLILDHLYSSRYRLIIRP